MPRIKPSDISHLKLTAPYNSYANDELLEFDVNICSHKIMRKKPIGSSFEDDAIVKQMIMNSKKADEKFMKEFHEGHERLKEKKAYLAKLEAEEANQSQPKKEPETKKNIKGLIKDIEEYIK